MPLDEANRLGLYEILASLGAVGMGEVYRARDTKLGSRDGERFLMIKLGGDASSACSGLAVVVDWFKEVKRLVPTNN